MAAPTFGGMKKMKSHFVVHAPHQTGDVSDQLWGGSKREHRSLVPPTARSPPPEYQIQAMVNATLTTKGVLLRIGAVIDGEPSRGGSVARYLRVGCFKVKTVRSNKI